MGQASKPQGFYVETWAPPLEEVVSLSQWKLLATIQRFQITHDKKCWLNNFFNTEYKLI